MRCLGSMPWIAQKEKLERLSKASVATLVEALKDQDNYVRAEAARRLGHKGPEAKEAVPALVTALGDKVGYVRSEVAKTIGRIGPAANPPYLACLRHSMTRTKEFDWKYAWL